MLANATPNPSPHQERGLGAVADGARLAALRELGVLDTVAEPEFDRFTSLAADLLGVPVSLVSLVDRDRQFFKSAHGLTGVWAAAGETPLSHSLCQHAVASGEPLVVPDARRDPRVADSLAVRDMSVRAYAGVPLVLADGHAVGALCAIDERPREWTERDLRVLGDLAAAVASLLDLRRALARQTLHDSLTGLPGRALTVAHAEHLSRSAEDAPLLALAVGIDHMSAVNASYGIPQGDRLINLVARRIAHQLTPDDVLGRVHGDAFLVLRPQLFDELAAVELAHSIRTAIGAEPVMVDGDPLAVSATVGMTTAVPGLGADQLVSRALECLEEAKATSEQVRFSAAGTRRRCAVRTRLRSALAGAVRRGEISVNFQPIVGLGTGSTRSYEALARWRHPQLGLVGPAEFIPLAEETGDIVGIGEHVLRTACTQVALWRQMISGDELGATVNISPVQLAVPNIAEVVSSILSEAGLPASALTLEITEGVFIAAGALPRRNLAAIQELGVRIALDDFGTGYSALGYLKRFPVDVIKVDRCFLDGLETDHRNAALMRAILAIGAGMEIEVVVEGVETAAQRELLTLSGCQWGQGFLFAEPLPAEQIRVSGRRTPQRGLAAVD